MTLHVRLQHHIRNIHLLCNGFGGTLLTIPVGDVESVAMLAIELLYLAAPVVECIGIGIYGNVLFADSP